MTFATVKTPPQLPFQLLEINIISAQDLAPLSRNMKTYAIAWIHPDRKLSTRVDTTNKSNPTWNDKFVFRVDDAFLRSDTSAVMVEIYAISFFRDQRVGNVRVLVSNLIPPASRAQPQNAGMRFVALQVRRPSGRPQGILNLGVALLDGSMRSMPIYTQLASSAVGYRDLMGEEAHSPHHHHHHNPNNVLQIKPKPAPALRKSRSERHSNVTDADMPRKSGITGSEFGEPPLATITTTGSIWSESSAPTPSVAAGLAPDELYEKNNNPGTIDILEKWGEKDKVEDLKSKLERWRTELPPVYDRSGNYGSYKMEGRHMRRHTDGGAGLFSCFGDLYGFECSITCGVKPKKGKGKEQKGMTLSEEDDISQSFI